MKQPNIPLLSPLNPFLEMKINTQLLLPSAPAIPAEPAAAGRSQRGMEPAAHGPAGARGRGAPAAGKSCSEERVIWDLDELDVHR